jgi:hypothetical protein
MVYHNDHNSKTTSKSTKTTTTNPYTGWQTYSDSYASFKYPSSWQTGIGQDKYTTHDINITSPGFISNAMSTATNPGTPVTVSLDLSTDSSMATFCNEGYTCQVVTTIALNNPQLPNSSFVIVNQTSPNGTNFSQYEVAGNSSKVGDTTINPLKFGNNDIYIFGQPYYTPQDGGLTIAARVTNPTTIQTDTHFKDLVNLINSIKFD